MAREPSGIEFGGELAAGVELVLDGVAAAVGPGDGIAGGVVGPAFDGVVGVGDGGEVALGVVAVAGRVALGVEQRVEALQRSGVGEAGVVARAGRWRQ